MGAGVAFAAAMAAPDVLPQQFDAHIHWSAADLTVLMKIQLAHEFVPFVLTIAVGGAITGRMHLNSIYDVPNPNHIADNRLGDLFEVKRADLPFQQQQTLGIGTCRMSNFTVGTGV
jgi:hypothetical protein